MPLVNEHWGPTTIGPLLAEGVHLATDPPAALADGEHCAVAVLGLVSDPALQLHDDEPFWDIVSWWPDRKVWTVTHRTRADVDAVDHVVTVVAWKALPPVPPRGVLWR